ncbi:DUF3426 domain-containing protein [Marinobacter piscensis]|uniref:DUF3426 domain-containing protein n=1 Tax=Marinobacter piscensis TaxID=1562308 RepID=UPI0011A55863|nr:DUF3426 domain-containing protein [Marinobacter piscensis]
MPQNALQTQCPKCLTRFLVTSEQLGVASGKVRCGHCLEIFYAADHEIKQATNTSPEQAPPTFSSDPTDEDILFADNPEEDAAEGQYAGASLTFSDDELSDSIRNHAETAASEPADNSETSPEEVDESWAEAILWEDEIPSAHTEATSSPEPEGDLHAGPPEDAQDDTPLVASRPFDDLRHDPVSVNSRKSSWLRTLVWSVIVLGLLGVLVAQVTWFHFDRLSAIPELRPYYEKGCELAGCELKPLMSVDAIQSRKLVVRTNPENRSQLIVDAVIINRAGFQQPFPAIALTFSNLNGDVVAQSVFTPEEYLAGDASPPDMMQTETPVRIAIHIRDPGRDAVNYSMTFRPYSP